MAGRQDIKAGSAYVELLLKDSKFVKGLHAASVKLRNFGSDISGIGVRMSVAGAAIAVPLLAAAKHFADFGSTLNDMRARTGISAQALAELGYAAQQTGANIEDVETGVRKMQKLLASAAGGSKEATKTIRALGLTLGDLRSKSPEDQFAMISEKIAAIQDPAKRTKALLDVFGKSGTKLKPMIDDLADLRAEARELGLVPTDAAVQAADDLGDAFDRVKSTIGAVVFSIGGALAPVLTKAATEIARVVANISRWVNENPELVQMVGLLAVKLIAAGAAVTAIGVTISGLGVILGGLATGITAVATVISLIVSPLGVAVAAVGTLIYAFLKLTKVGAGIRAAFGNMFDRFKAGLGAIIDALKAGDVQGAMGILTTTLDAQWQALVGSLKNYWIDFKYFLYSIFDSIVVEAKGMVLKISKAIAYVKAVAKNPFASQAKAKEIFRKINEEFADREKKQQAAAEAAGKVNTAMRDAEKQVNIDQARDAQQAMNEAIIAARAKAGEAVTRQRQGGMSNEDFAKLSPKEQAKILAASSAGLDADAKKKKIAQAAADNGAGAKSEVFGTFSAAALAGGGGAASGVERRLDVNTKELTRIGRIIEKQLDEQRRANRVGA